MSKFVKDLQMKHLRTEFEGVGDLLVVNMIGLNAVETNKMRLELRKKGIRVQVIKNALALKVFGERGVSGLDPLLTGTSAVAWGGPGIVELAKEITDWAKKIKKFEIKGGCVAGQRLDPEGVKQLSTMPSREELLGQVLGMLMGVGGGIIAMLNQPARQVASQIQKLAEREGAGESTASEPAASEAAAPSEPAAAVADAAPVTPAADAPTT